MKEMFIELTLALRDDRFIRLFKMTVENLSRFLCRLGVINGEDDGPAEQIAEIEAAANEMFDTYRRLSAVFDGSPAPEEHGGPYIRNARIVTANEVAQRGPMPKAYIYLNGHKMGQWFVE